MARTGRPPVPTRLKIARGNPGQRPLPENEPEPEVVASVPMPSGMPAGARAEWKRITAELAALKLLATADQAVIASYCLAVDRLYKSARQLQRTADYIGPRGQSTWVKIQREAIADIRALCAEFGLSPAARVRVSAKRSEGGKTEFERLMDETCDETIAR